MSKRTALETLCSDLNVSIDEYKNKKNISFEAGKSILGQTFLTRLWIKTNREW